MRGHATNNTDRSVRGGRVILMVADGTAESLEGHLDSASYNDLRANSVEKLYRKASGLIPPVAPAETRKEHESQPTGS